MFLPNQGINRGFAMFRRKMAEAIQTLRKGVSSIKISIDFIVTENPDNFGEM